jgi:ligand-binding SRPBCC domain-containing protein
MVMVIVERSTRLEASADAVWAAVKTPAAFRTVTRRLLVMPVISGRADEWREGETVVGWVFLFGVVPFSRHHLQIAGIDESTRMLSSREHGGLIMSWNHDIVVTPLDEAQCTYQDRIEIDAGILTPLVAVYAQWFYSMRQRRWRALAKGLKK